MTVPSSWLPQQDVLAHPNLKVALPPPPASTFSPGVCEPRWPGQSGRGSLPPGRGSGSTSQVLLQPAHHHLVSATTSSPTCCGLRGTATRACSALTVSQVCRVCTLYLLQTSLAEELAAAVREAAEDQGMARALEKVHRVYTDRAERPVLKVDQVWILDLKKG